MVVLDYEQVEHVRDCPKYRLRGHVPDSFIKHPTLSGTLFSSLENGYAPKLMLLERTFT